MRLESLFTFLDFFVGPSSQSQHRDTLIKSRIFVVACLLLAGMSLIDGARDTWQGRALTITEILNPIMAFVCLACHYRYGRPQYFILPFAMLVTLLLALTVIVPSNSLLSPTMQWLPLIAGAVFFVSGRRWGLLFASGVVALTLWLHRDHVSVPVNLPHGISLQQYTTEVPIVLCQVLAAVSIMALAYLNLHRRARVELASVQTQVAQALRAAENSDFSHNLRTRLDRQLKPLRFKVGDGRQLVAADCIAQLQEVRQVLSDLREYTALQRTVYENEVGAAGSLITWEESVRRIRSLLPGRHGLLMIRYEDSFESTSSYKLDSRLMLILLEGLRLLCYQTQVRGEALLHLSTHILGQELAFILNLTLEKSVDIPPGEKVMNEQKLELSEKLLLQSLHKQGGTLQMRQKDRSFWLQIAIPLPTRVA